MFIILDNRWWTKNRNSAHQKVLNLQKSDVFKQKSKMINLSDRIYDIIFPSNR